MLTVNFNKELNIKNKIVVNDDHDRQLIDKLVIKESLSLPYTKTSTI